MNTTTLANALKAVFGNGSVNNPSSSSLIPYCGSNGLPAGLASMVNLASVLGGVKFYNNADKTDITTGIWITSAQINSDKDVWAQVISIKTDGNYITQIGGIIASQDATNWPVGGIRGRSYNGSYWTSWTR